MIEQLVILLSPILDKSLSTSTANIDDLFHHDIRNNKLVVELKIRYNTKRTFNAIVRRTYNYYRDIYPEETTIVLRYRPRVIANNDNGTIIATTSNKSYIIKYF
jgi:hypothetical protein